MFRGGLGVQRDYRYQADGRFISVLERCTGSYRVTATTANGGTVTLITTTGGGGALPRLS